MAYLDKVSIGGTLYNVQDTDTQAGVANVFSTSTAYTAGQYVWYDNGNGAKLYRFTADHAAGAWTGTDAMNVALGNDVTDLKSAISDISEKTIVSDNFLPPAQESGMYDTTTGAKTSASWMVRTPNAIKIPDGVSTIYIRADVTFANALGVFEYATSDTDSFIRVTSYYGTDRATVALNSSTKYIRLSISNNYSISNFSVNTSDVAYNEYEEKNKIIKEALPQIADEDLPENIIKSQLITSANYFDNSSYVANEWIKSDGTISADAGYYHSNAIPLPAGDYVTIAFKGSYYGNAVYVHLYNTSGEWTGKVEGTLLTDDGNNSLMTFTLSADSLVKINLTASGKDTDMIIEGDTAADYPSTFIPYKHYNAVESGIHLNSAMENDVREIIQGDEFSGKKLSVNGDSICAGVGYSGGYAKIIGNTFGMVVQNIGVGGGTITAETYNNDSTARHWICRTIQNMDSDADYAILEGGVNDASMSVTLGQITANYNSTLDDTTFYGAVESMCKQMQSRFAGKKYGFIITHKCSVNLRPSTDYYNALIACFEKWGIPYLNLNIEVPAFGMFASSDTTNYPLTQAYTYNSDGWHPNEQGYKKYYVPKIVAWMKTL